MSTKNKLAKFAELMTYPHVFENFDYHTHELQGENGETIELKGKWNDVHFKNKQPIVLELACGRGEYSVGLAERYPDRNFIGVDIKGARIWKGASISLEKGLTNVAFLRTRIELIEHFFEKDEVSEIWITFPDPFITSGEGKGKPNRRLTAAPFLERYRKILAPNGIVNLKTDDDTLYHFTVETVLADERCTMLYHENDIYSKPLHLDVLELKTRYEGMHLEKNKKIKFVQFKIN
jgi:tRNA (guanine-N7-)-methyltransferase